MGKHSTQRIYAAAALVPGDDEDLISWLDQCPKGERSSLIKKALRVGLGLHQEEEKPQPDNRLMDDLRKQQEHTVKWMQDWIDFLQKEIRDLRTTGMSATYEPVMVQDTPQLSEDEAARIAAKMKKAKW